MLKWSLRSGALLLTVNGVPREFGLEPGAVLTAFVAELGFRPDRVALEQNGAIVPRTRWPETEVREGDRLEVVHFVGGGTAAPGCDPVSSCNSFSHCRP